MKREKENISFSSKQFNEQIPLNIYKKLCLLAIFLVSSTNVSKVIESIMCYNISFLLSVSTAIAIIVLDDLSTSLGEERMKGVQNLMVQILH